VEEVELPSKVDSQKGIFSSTSSGDAGLNEDGNKQLIWVVVSNIFYVHPYLGK